jgi:hypothetical protein
VGGHLIHSALRRRTWRQAVHGGCLRRLRGPKIKKKSVFSMKCKTKCAHAKTLQGQRSVTALANCSELSDTAAWGYQEVTEERREDLTHLAQVFFSMQFSRNKRGDKNVNIGFDWCPSYVQNWHNFWNLPHNSATNQIQFLCNQLLQILKYSFPTGSFYAFALFSSLFQSKFV